MTCTCPHCGRTFEPASVPDPIEAKVAELRRQCQASREWMSPDGRVAPETVARILGNKPSTLANWRSGENPLPFHRTGGGRGRITYDLVEVARFIVRKIDR